MRHVAGGARATVRRAGPAEPVLEPTTGVCTTGGGEPLVGCVTCSRLERGDAPVSRSNDERTPLSEVTSADEHCNRGWGTVAGTGMLPHRRWPRWATARLERPVAGNGLMGEDTSVLRASGPGMLQRRLRPSTWYTRQPLATSHLNPHLIKTSSRHTSTRNLLVFPLRAGRSRPDRQPRSSFLHKTSAFENVYP